MKDLNNKFNMMFKYRSGLCNQEGFIHDTCRGNILDIYWLKYFSEFEKQERGLDVVAHSNMKYLDFLPFTIPTPFTKNK